MMTGGLLLDTTRLRHHYVVVLDTISPHEICDCPRVVSPGFRLPRAPLGLADQLPFRSLVGGHDLGPPIDRDCLCRYEQYEVGEGGRFLIRVGDMLTLIGMRILP